MLSYEYRYAVSNQNGISLPTYSMVAGESKTFTIPIYNQAGKQIDATGMTARLAICDYINSSMSPFVIKECNVIPWGDGTTALNVSLRPVDTINLCGKYIYQITGKDVDDDFGVLCGYLTIHLNRDRAAIQM